MPPSRFDAVITKVFQPSSLTPVTSFTTRGRYLISDSAASSSSANYLTIGSTPLGTDSTYGTNTGYAATQSNLISTSTVQNYLASLMLVVAAGDGNFIIQSQLNPNDAIDYVSNSKVLQFTNNFGLTSSTNNGYITFSYNSTTHLIQAQSRYIYGLSSTVTTSPPSTTWAATETLDKSFTASNYYIKLSNGTYSLVATQASATPFYLYSSPFDFGIPTDFNPNSNTYVTNAAAPFVQKITSGISSIETSSGKNSLYGQLNSTYRAQVLYPGSNTATKSSADAMLASIVSTASANNFKLRYSAALYTAYRDATLAYTLTSDSVSDGVPGQHLVPFVYYTNEKDSSGVYHPMMVIVHYGNQASPNGLIDINKPPGSAGASYNVATVTRYSNLDYYVTAIPMKDYGIVTNVLDNTISPTLYSEVNNGSAPSSSVATAYNYASTADNGILIDGSVIFPVMNNTIIPSQSQAELSASGCHVGQGGGGPHCHADGYRSGTQYGTAVYGDLDYVGNTHPPLIGFGYDGVALYGRYRTGTGTDDSAMIGANTALDQFGGHTHSPDTAGLGYHYHAHTLSTSSWTSSVSGSTNSYTLHILLNGAWAGNVNSIPYFYTNSSFNTNKYLGGQ